MADIVNSCNLGASDVADYRYVRKMCKIKWRIPYGGHMFKICQNIKIWPKTRCAEPDRPRWGQFAPGPAGRKSELPPPPPRPQRQGEGGGHRGPQGRPGGGGGGGKSGLGIPPGKN